MRTYILIYPFNIGAQNNFVVKYNPTLLNLTNIIHKHSNILYSSDRCKNVFKALAFVASVLCKNISHILIRAQLSKTRFNSQGSFRCNSNSCGTCPCTEHGCNEYTFYSAGESHKIKSPISCNTLNVIYMIHSVNYVVFRGNQTWA